MSPTSYRAAPPRGDSRQLTMHGPVVKNRCGVRRRGRTDPPPPPVGERRRLSENSPKPARSPWPERGDRGRLRQRVDVGRLPLHGGPEVGLADDVVAVEDRSGLVAAHAHCHALGNAGPHEVPYGRAPKVMEGPPRSPGGDPGPSAGSGPRLAEVHDGAAIAVKDEVGNTGGLIGPRHHPRLPTPVDERLEVASMASVRPWRFLECSGRSRTTPPSRSTSAHVSDRISPRRQPVRNANRATSCKYTGRFAMMISYSPTSKNPC